MTPDEFLPALLAALPAPARAAPAPRKFDKLIDAARQLARLHAATKTGAAGLTAGLAVLERCFAEGTKGAALEAAALLHLLLEFALDLPGRDHALAARLPPLTRQVCQQLWISQGELSEWMDSNLPLAGDEDA